MTTITREQAQSVSDLKAGYTLGHADVAILNELARIALAAMDSEPVGITDRSEIEFLKRGEMASVMPPDYKGVDAGDEVYVYTSPPATVAMDDAKLRKLFDAWFASDCSFDLSPEASEEDNIAWRESYWYVWQRCRAAMLQGKADGTLTNEDTRQAGNSPVIPDGWIKSSERMPGSQEWVIVFAKWANQQVLCWDDVENRWTDFEDQSYVHDVFSHWMPLPAPPQEVPDGKV